MTPTVMPPPSPIRAQGPDDPARAGRVEGYSVPQPEAPADLRLDANIGPIPEPRLFDACQGRLARSANAYPSARELEARWAGCLGVAPEWLKVTGGADDALERIVRAFVGPSRELLATDPTFEMLERYCAQAGGRYVRVAWPRGPLPVESILARVTPATALIAVVSPNNPTGCVASAEDLRRLSQEAPHALLLVDLVYGDFADEDLMPTALSLPRAVVTRTLSKAWGLAGLRVGCAIGAPALLAELAAIGTPYPVSGVSMALAEEALATGGARVARGIAQVRRERDRLAALLRELGADPVPSQANFVLARLRDAAWTWDALAGLGIATRRFPGRPGLDDALRISCPADEPAFERLCHALATALRPEAILFDLDGVIADVSGSYRASIVQTAAAFGASVSPREIARAKAEGCANNDWELTARLMAERGIDRPLAEVRERFESIYQGAAGRPGLRDEERCLVDPAWLRELGRRFPLGLVTGRPRQDARRFLDQHRLTGLFGACVVMEDGPAKPDPAPVELALDRLGVRRAWMIGDTPDDIGAARAAGVLPIGVLAPGGDAASRSALERAGAARVLDGCRELEDLLP